MLTTQSLFLYGYQITENNRSIDFKISGGGSELQATLTIGYYSLSSLMSEIKTQLQAADPSNTYTVTADRTYVGGTENRVTIATSGAFLSLLFLTGSRNASSVDTLLGFTHTDKTGFTTYTGTLTSGTALVSPYNGFEYQSTSTIRKINGSVNISTSGKKEAIVYSIMKFFEVKFKYIAAADIPNWVDFFEWAIQQRLLEFTPEITSPTVFVECTLESTSEDSKGLGYRLREMRSENLYNLFDTGVLKFREDQ